MQLLLKTLSSKTIVIDVNADDTVASVMRKVHGREGIPPAQQRLLCQNRELQPRMSLSGSGVRNHDTLQLLLSLRGGGGDGGSTCNDRLWVEMRGDILNTDANFAKKQTQDRDQIATGKAVTCCVSSFELEEPVMCCELGYLYNKEALLRKIITKELPDKYSHIRSLKDVVEIKLTTKEGAGSINTDSDGKVGHQGAKYICPVTMRDMNGFNKFCVLRSSKVMMSMEAIHQVAEATKTCPITGMSFDPAEDIILLYPDEEELESQRGRMKARKKAAKASKKSSKKAAAAAGGAAGAADISAKAKYVNMGGKSKMAAPTESKRKADQFSQSRIAQETAENLKKMKSSTAFSSLFSEPDATRKNVSANDLFNRRNGAVGLRS